MYYTIILCASAHMESKVDTMPFCVNTVPYQQEIKRERSAHLISPDMVTKESNLQGRFKAHSATTASIRFLCRQPDIPPAVPPQKPAFCVFSVYPRNGSRNAVPVLFLPLSSWKQKQKEAGSSPPQTQRPYNSSLLPRLQGAPTPPDRKSVV